MRRLINQAQIDEAENHGFEADLIPFVRFVLTHRVTGYGESSFLG